MALGRPAGKVVSAAAQAEQVDELQVCPRQLVMFVGERYTLTPIALDVNPGDGSKKVVHGVGMSWSSPVVSVARVSSFGQVEAMGVGSTAVEVQCGGASKLIPVEVRSGMRPTGSNQEADINPTNDCAGEQSSTFAPQSATVAPAQQSLIDGNGVSLDWDPFRRAILSPRTSGTPSATRDSRQRVKAAAPSRPVRNSAVTAISSTCRWRASAAEARAPTSA